MNSVPGFIIKKVYPHLNGKLCVEAESFLNKQPSNIVSLLRWESKQYAKGAPERDPSVRDFIHTKHPNIYYSTPKRWDRGKDKVPIFFCCSHCKGRAFWSTPVCAWCGENILSGVEENIDNDTFFSLVDYLYPPSNKPPIAKILSKVVEENKINIHELEQELKTIKEHIPTTAHKRIDFGLYGDKWCLAINNDLVPLDDMGIKNKNGFADLYYLKSNNKKYYLSRALAEAYNDGTEISIKKIPLKELTVSETEKVLTLIPKNSNLNLGVTVL